MALEKIDIDTLDPAATIVVATGNAHKLTEIEAILGKVMPEVRFVALGQLGDFEDPEENGTTFLENAIIKAQAAVEETGLMAIADDSGLVVDALDGEPGVYSARYAGVHGDDAANNAKLLVNLEGVADEDRTARESNEHPVTARPSRRSDPRSSPLLLSRSARAATVVVVIRSDWCILNLSG